MAQRELGITLGPAVNIGSVRGKAAVRFSARFSATNTSLFGGEVVYPENAGPWILEVIEDPPRDVPRLIRAMEKRDVLQCGVTPLMLGWRQRILAFLTADLYRRFCLERERAWYDHFSQPGVERRSFHSDSENTHVLAVLNELELSDVNLGPTVDPLTIRERMPKSVIYGQMPPFLLREGTVEEVMVWARLDIAKVAGDGDLVLDSAGSINDGTPHENVRAMVRAAELYGRYENGQLVSLGRDSEESHWWRCGLPDALLASVFQGRVFVLPLDRNGWVPNASP